jgi:hypothetical protein
MSNLSPWPITFLPLDLHRWDRGPGGDVLVVPIWSDVRPLRGATGLVDWRLCGKLSQMIRQGRLSGSTGEKLLLVTSRLLWSRVLGIGIGPCSDFGGDACRAFLECALEAARGIGAVHVALALAGRDLDLIKPDLAMRSLLEAIEKSHDEQGDWLQALTIIDVPQAAKAMGGSSRPGQSPARAPSAASTEAPSGDGA